MTIATEFSITQAMMYADRETPNGSVDIKNMIIELSLFESLDKLYYSGQLVVLDDLGIFDEFQLQGTERLLVDLVGGDWIDKGNRDLTVQANIVSIHSTHKQGDKQELYAINFIAPHMFDDEMKKLSKSYTGKLETIAANILLNELNVNTWADEYYFGTDPTAQKEVRVIAPYTSPTETVKWLLDRATGDNGTPYFVWQSIWGQEPTQKWINFGNLRTMIEEGIKREKERNHPFVSTMMGVNRGTASDAKADKPARDTTDQDYLITGYKFTNIEDTLEMTRNGAVGSMLNSFDTFTTQNIERHLSIKDIVDNFEDKVFDFVYDDEFIVDTTNKKMAEENARYRNIVTSYGTYASINSYHDVFDQTEALNKVRSVAMKSAMYRNMIQASFHGIQFWESEFSVGDIIECEFFTASNYDEDAGKISQRRSGYYLIHDLRHHFIEGRHSVTCSLCKVRDLDDKPTYEGGK